MIGTFERATEHGPQNKASITHADQPSFKPNRRQLSILHLQRTIGNRAVQRLLAASKPATPTLQRTATWQKATPQGSINLAAVIMGIEKVADNQRAIGVTHPLLNDKPIELNTDPQAFIQPPEVISIADLTGGGFDVHLGALPTNTGSYDEKVLASPPWEVDVPKHAVQQQFGLKACSGAGTTSFRASGHPNDQEMLHANRRHEDHHARDHEDAFNETIVPWDAKVTAVQQAGTAFHGHDLHEAFTNLYSQAGGNPKQVARDYKQRAYAKSDVFHHTPQGGDLGEPTNKDANDDCSRSSATYPNPG